MSCSPYRVFQTTPFKSWPFAAPHSKQNPGQTGQGAGNFGARMLRFAQGDDAGAVVLVSERSVRHDRPPAASNPAALAPNADRRIET